MIEIRSLKILLKSFHEKNSDLFIKQHGILSTILATGCIPFIMSQAIGQSKFARGPKLDEMLTLWGCLFKGYD